MAFYIKPEYFQVIHYYFFSLGIFSLTIAFLFPDYNAFTILFMTFYIFHSGISWYMSWFMHKKMDLVFIINKAKYAVEHVVLTVLSGGMAVLLYYTFQSYYESLMTSILTINFFVIFLGVIWYVLGAAKISHKFFEWQEGRRMRIGRDMILSFRKKRRVKLIDDESIKRYKWGEDSTVDRLIMEIKMIANKGHDFSENVKDVEVRLAQKQIDEFQQKITKLEEGIVTESDRNLVNSYKKAIKEQEIRVMQYEREFKKMELLEKT